MRMNLVADFPLLERLQGELVYLDSASTAQKPWPVMEALRSYYERSCANVHRGLYPLAEQATAAYEGARDRVARFLGVSDRRGVVFTRSCTEAVNLVAYAWARRTLVPGDEILTTELEHHSNLLPWQQAARDTGASLRVVPLRADGQLSHADVVNAVTDRTRLLAVTGLSNVLGSVVDLAPMVAAARGAGALVLVDAAQLVTHRPVSFEALGADFMVVSGHKLMGPTGVGVLAGRPEVLERMEPFLFGGEMVLEATAAGAVWAGLPHKFEGGTPPIASAIGLGAAVDYLDGLGFARLIRHDARLVQVGLDLLAGVKGVRLYGGGADPDRVATFSFNLFDAAGHLVHPHDVGGYLASRGIAIRAGHHCAQPLMRHFGVPAMCRASAYLYNSEEDLARLAEALDGARDLYARG